MNATQVVSIAQEFLEHLVASGHLEMPRDPASVVQDITQVLQAAELTALQHAKDVAAANKTLPGAPAEPPPAPAAAPTPPAPPAPPAPPTPPAPPAAPVTPPAQ